MSTLYLFPSLYSKDKVIFILITKQFFSLSLENSVTYIHQYFILVHRIITSFFDQYCPNKESVAHILESYIILASFFLETFVVNVVYKNSKTIRKLTPTGMEGQPEDKKWVLW